MRSRWTILTLAVVALTFVVLEQRHIVTEGAATADQRALIELRAQAAETDRMALLSARFEVIETYDPLVSALDDLRQSTRRFARGHSDDPALIAFQGRLEERTALVESLKFARAIERNSRAYVAAAIENPAADDGQRALFGQLAAWLLNPANVRARDRLHVRLDELDEVEPTVLATHMRALLSSGEHLDGLTLDLLRAPLATPAAALAERYAAAARDAAARSARYRLALLAMLLLTALWALRAALRPHR